MKSVSILLLTTLLAALIAENASAAADAVIEEKAVPLEPLYPDSWYNGEGEEEDERDLRFDANTRAARVSETEGGLAPKTELRGTEDVELRAARMDLRAARMEPARRAELRIGETDTVSKNELGLPIP